MLGHMIVKFSKCLPTPVLQVWPFSYVKEFVMYKSINVLKKNSERFGTKIEFLTQQIDEVDRELMDMQFKFKTMTPQAMRVKLRNLFLKKTNLEDQKKKKVAKKSMWDRAIHTHDTTGDDLEVYEALNNMNTVSGLKPDRSKIDPDKYEDLLDQLGNNIEDCEDEEASGSNAVYENMYNRNIDNDDDDNDSSNSINNQIEMFMKQAESMTLENNMPELPSIYENSKTEKTEYIKETDSSIDTRDTTAVAAYI
jgi:hypothetical protein